MFAEFLHVDLAWNNARCLKMYIQILGCVNSFNIYTNLT